MVRISKTSTTTALRLGFFLAIALLFILDSEAATIHGTVFDYSLNKVNNANVEIDSIPKQRDVTEDGTYLFSVKEGSYTITARLYENGVVTASSEEKIELVEGGDYTLDIVLFPDLSEEEGILNYTEQIDQNIDSEIFEESIDNRTSFQVITGIIFIICIIFFFVIMLRKKPEEEQEAVGTEHGKKSDENNMNDKNKTVENHEAADITKDENKTKEGNRFCSSINNNDEKGIGISSYADNKKNTNNNNNNNNNNAAATAKEENGTVITTDISTGKTKTLALADDLQELVGYIRSEGNRVTQLDIRQRFPSSEAKISLMLTELEDKGIIRKIKKGRGNIVILNN